MDEIKLSEARAVTRRTFFSGMGAGIGAMALDALMAQEGQAQRNALAPKKPHHKARAKSVIYLHASGAPPTLDMFDYKPKLVELNLKPCPESLMKGERFAFIKGVPTMLGSPHKFKQCGQNGAYVSELLPGIGSIVDDITIVRSMNTDQFNHAPAEMFLYTGSANPGDAAMGSWLTYGLGSENQDLPGFVVLVSGGTDPTGGKSLWNSGFLPSVYQGVQCRSTGEPILYLNDPPGLSRADRRRSLDALEKLNAAEAKQFGDPETLTRIAQYELAYRMQMAVPEVTDVRKEPQHILDMYGVKPGEASFAKNCLLARRMVEKGVRYVQLYDWGWDIHGTGPGDDLMTAFPQKCKDMDRAASALIKDLKQRGMLDDTLVVWGGEFGRTPMNEARGGSKHLGRDHHPHCFCIWMAGGGIKKGLVYGETDEFGYRIVRDKVTIRDLQATILHQMGLDPYTLSYPYQGLNHRLIGPTEEAVIRKGLLS
ncbi:MAG: DUF1501 domain-containing protein [Armatimonadetes bacterium]|nr:DUF1501 domain-containing protein [Armatimonadota bacterium]